jgi:hypothetical protein
MSDQNWGNDPLQKVDEQSWGNDPLVKPKGPVSKQIAKASQPASFMDRLKDAVYTKPTDTTMAQRATDYAKMVLVPLGGAGVDWGDVASETGKEFMRNATQLRKDVLPQNKEELLDATSIGLPGIKPALDAVGMAMSPVVGLATSAVGAPLERMTGVRKEVTGNALAMLMPGMGEAKAVKGVEDAAKGVEGLRSADQATKAAHVTAAIKAAKPDAEVTGEIGDLNHRAKVDRLRAEGVKPTAGQIVGGRVRRFEEAYKSDPLVGHAIRGHETTALETYNRALYNRVLKPIGAKVSPTIQTDRTAVKAIGDRISQEYEKLKPQMRIVMDDDVIDGIKQIKNKVTELPPAQQSQFEAILSNRLVHRVGYGGEGTGEEFKLIESDLTREARDYKSSPDPVMRKLGDALEDVTGVLRENVEKYSAPGIRQQLKKTNESWSLLTRLEDAAQARKGSGGLVTPGDLLGSVRKMDRTVRHRSFARGDAMLQQFAEDGADVLGNKLPDSGTTERASTIHHGLLTSIAGAFSNPAASAGMRLLRDFAESAPRTREVLGGAKQQSNTLPMLMRAAPRVNALRYLSQQPQQQ